MRFFGRVLRYFRPDSSKIVWLLGLIGASTLVGLASVWPMAILVDSVLKPLQAGAGSLSGGAAVPGSQVRVLEIAGLAGATFLLRILQELLSNARSLLHVRISHNGLLRVRCDLFRKLQTLNLRFHRAQPQGDTIYRLTNDALGCQQIATVLIDLAVAVCTLSVMLGIMFSRSAELTLIALGVAPLLLATNLAFGRLLRNRSRLARQLDSQFTSTLQRSVSAIGLTQAFGRESTEYERFRGHAGESLEAAYRTHRQMAWYRLCVGFIFGAGAALIFGYGGWQAYRDQILGANPEGMTVGSLVVFLTYLGMFYDPLCKLSGASASMTDGITAVERVFDVLDREGVVCDAPDAVELAVQPRTLALDNLSFQYEAGKPVLRNVSLSIAPGEMVAFVGSSGVGKSTILNLLARFFEPTSGAVRLDGTDIRDVRLRDLRRHFALVAQDNLLLPTSIAENIGYGRPDATLEDIRRAAELAGIAATIEALPEGYATDVAEGGQNLSGGQRQRIAIARALLTEAPILVLDEPTSALDAEHERQIVQTLGELRALRTIVLVSHRLSTVVGCDRIFMMHEGRLVDTGTHDELVARHEWYAKAASHQVPLRRSDTSTPASNAA